MLKTDLLKSLPAVQVALTSAHSALSEKATALANVEGTKNALLSALFSAPYIQKDSELIDAAIALLTQEKLKDCCDAYKWAIANLVADFIVVKYDGKGFVFLIKDWGDYDALARLLKDKPAFSAYKAFKAAEKAAEKKRAEERAREQLRTGRRCELVADKVTPLVDSAIKAQDRAIKAVESEVFSEEQGGDKVKAQIQQAMKYVRSDLCALNSILKWSKDHGVTVQDILAKIEALNA